MVNERGRQLRRRFSVTFFLASCLLQGPPGLAIVRDEILWLDLQWTATCAPATELCQSRVFRQATATRLAPTKHPTGWRYGSFPPAKREPSQPATCIQRLQAPIFRMAFPSVGLVVLSYVPQTSAGHQTRFNACGIGFVGSLVLSDQQIGW